MNPKLANKPISADDANEEINEFMRITKNGYAVAESSINKTVPYDNNSEVFFTSNKNAFVFDRQSILKYFKLPDGSIPEVTDSPNTAQYLMIILGAHTNKTSDEQHASGSPTVIVTGVKAVTKKDPTGTPATTLQTTLGGTTPADEWPDQLTVSVLPTIVDNGITFEIL